MQIINVQVHWDSFESSLTWFPPSSRSCSDTAAPGVQVYRQLRAPARFRRSATFHLFPFWSSPFRIYSLVRLLFTFLLRFVPKSRRFPGFFRRFRSYYGLDVGKKAQGEAEEKAPSKHTLFAQEQRRNKGIPKIDPLLEEQFNTGRLLACISSRPGQVGRADGYILEASFSELHFIFVFSSSFEAFLDFFFICQVFLELSVPSSLLLMFVSSPFAFSLFLLPVFGARGLQNEYSISYLLLFWIEGLLRSLARFSVQLSIACGC